MAFSFVDKLHASRRTFLILLITLFLTTVVLADKKCDCKSPSTIVCQEACEEVNSSIDWVGALHKVTAVAGAASTFFGLYAAINNHNQNNARHQAYMAQQEQQKQIATYNNNQRKGGDESEWDWLVPLLGFGAQLLAG